MKTIAFNEKEIRIIEQGNQLFFNVVDIQVALEFKINLSKSNGCRTIHIGAKDKAHIIIDDLIVRLGKVNIKIYKLGATELQKIVEDYKEEYDAFHPQPIAAPPMPPVDNKIAINFLNAAISLLSKSCDKCSIEFDTNCYPCDQCITSPHLISHFKLED